MRHAMPDDVFFPSQETPLVVFDSSGGCFRQIGSTIVECIQMFGCIVGINIFPDTLKFLCQSIPSSVKVCRIDGKFLILHRRGISTLTRLRQSQKRGRANRSNSEWSRWPKRRRQTKKPTFPK